MTEQRALGFHLRQMSAADRNEVTRLIFHSTNQYYLSIGRQPIFQGDDLSPIDMFDVYEEIDPGQGIVAEDETSGQIIGSCFVHPRETHYSLGIMNAKFPNFSGRGFWVSTVGKSVTRIWLGERQADPSPGRAPAAAANPRYGFMKITHFNSAHKQNSCARNFW